MCVKDPLCEGPGSRTDNLLQARGPGYRAVSFPPVGTKHTALWVHNSVSCELGEHESIPQRLSSQGCVWISEVKHCHPEPTHPPPSCRAWPTIRDILALSQRPLSL